MTSRKLLDISLIILPIVGVLTCALALIVLTTCEPSTGDLCDGSVHVGAMIALVGATVSFVGSTCIAAYFYREQIHTSDKWQKDLDARLDGIESKIDKIPKEDSDEDSDGQ